MRIQCRPELLKVSLNIPHRSAKNPKDELKSIAWLPRIDPNIRKTPSLSVEL
jgi:hypothetical protein